MKRETYLRVKIVWSLKAINGHVINPSKKGTENTIGTLYTHKSMKNDTKQNTVLLND